MYAHFFLLISLSCSLSNKPANHSYRELCLRYTHNNVCRLFAVNDILYKILFQVAVFSDQKESLSNEITKKKTTFKATSFKAKQKAKKKNTSETSKCQISSVAKTVREDTSSTLLFSRLLALWWFFCLFLLDICCINEAGERKSLEYFAGVEPTQAIQTQTALCCPQAEASRASDTLWPPIILS